MLNTEVRRQLRKFSIQRSIFYIQNILNKRWLKGKYIFDLIEYPIHFSFRIGLHQPRTVGFEIRQAFKVIGIVSAHFKYPQAITFPANRKIEMLTADTHPFFDIGSR